MSGGIGNEIGKCYLMSGDNAIAGMGVKASGNTCTGNNAKTGGNLAAAKDAFDNRIAAGAFGCTTKCNGRCAPEESPDVK